ncbi:MAG: YncE family protein [Thermoplasmata archaeon]|nr:YncE family protein [Thermoplasmata archaeon]
MGLTAFAIVLIAILLASGVLGVNAPRPSSLPLRTATLPSPTLAPRPGVTSVFSGFSEQTLDLLNGTITPGDALPLDGVGPQHALYNPATNVVYTLSNGGSSKPGLVVINASSSQLLTEVSLDAGSAMALDGPAGLLLVAGGGFVTIVNASSYQIDATVAVGNDPVSIAVDPANGEAYVLNVANSGSGNVSVLDLTNDTVVAWIPVGNTPANIVDDPANGELYVTNSGSNNVSVINGSTNALAATIAVGSQPDAIAVDSANNTVYVLNGYPSTNLSILNGTTNTVFASVTVGSGTYGSQVLVDDPANSELYIALTYNNQVGVLSTRNNSLITKQPVGNQPEAIAIDAVIREVAVVNLYSANVSFLSTTTNLVTGSMAGPADPTALAVDTSNGTIFIPNTSADQVEAINGSARTVVANISTGLSPDWVGFDNATGSVYVTESDAGTVTVLNGSTGRILATVPAGAGASRLAVDVPNHRLMVTNTAADTVSSINTSTNTLVATARVGNTPASTAFDPANGDLYVANFYSHNVSVVNDSTGKLIATVGVGSNPDGVAFDAANGDLYVQSSWNGNVSVISGRTNAVVANVSLAGAYPIGIGYDPVTQMVCVLTLSPDAVEEISGTTNAVSATVAIGTTATSPNGMAINPVTGAIYVAQVGASYNGSVAIVNASSNTVVSTVTVGTTPGGMLVDPADGVVFVLNSYSNNLSVIGLSTDKVVSTIPVGASVSIAAFDPVSDTVFVSNGGQGTISIIQPPSPYDLNFTETGLPVGTTWTVTVDGATQSTAGSLLTFLAANGSHPFSVGPVSGYFGLPASGTATVNGSATVQTIAFEPTYSVNFQEHGLPNGTSWAIALNGSTDRTVSRSLAFEEPNGTYNFSVANVPGWRTTSYFGSVAVAGAPRNVTLGWNLTEFSVSFSASHLPGGKSWGVTLNGTTNRSSSDASDFRIGNGTYSYSVSGPAGFAPEPASGTVSVNDANVVMSIGFVEGFLVEFTEMGLPNGTAWAATLNGSQNSSTLSSLTFEVTNGSFGYSVSNVPGWRAGSYVGSVDVRGGNVSVSVAWIRSEYTVGFAESGLPKKTNWSVSIGATVSTSNASSTQLDEPNGSFAYSVGNVPGWRANQYRGNLTVIGSAVGVDTVWIQTVYNLTFSETGLPNDTLWSVGLNNSTPESTRTNVTFVVANGSQEYQVSGIPGWRASSYDGATTVAGEPKSLTIVWAVNTYAVQVNETGLPSGTTWAVTLSGTTIRTGTASLAFLLPNGTATFNVSNVAGWRASTYRFTLPVDGGIAQQTVRWLRTTFTVTIVASGLPSGTNWSVVVGNETASVDTGTISLTGLPNGTYSLAIPPVTGYHLVGPPTNLSVEGGPVVLQVTFVSSVTAPSGSTSSGPNALWFIALGLVVVGVTVAALVARRRRGRPAGPASTEGTDEGPAHSVSEPGIVGSSDEPTNDSLAAADPATVDVRGQT